MSAFQPAAFEAAPAEPARPYRLFDVHLARKVLLTPWMARLTFAGKDVAAMATHAPDQRIKILFPHENGALPTLADSPNWYAAYRALPPEQRAPIRTYTIRHLRADTGEVDVDFLLHGDNGPASRWAGRAEPGDRVKIMAPNRAFAGDPGGYEWRPPPSATTILLVGDETALPAIAGILDELAKRPNRPFVQAFIDAPADGRGIGLPSWLDLDLTWLRGPGEAHGGDNRMLDAVRRALLPNAEARRAPALETVDVDRQILWDRAEPAQSDFYAWVAGEAADVLAIRHFLVKDRGLDRRTLNLMGYWRRGQAIDERTGRNA